MTTALDNRPVKASKWTERTGRNMLIALGIGQFNATMVIPYLWIAPAATDPKAPQIILLVEHLQKRLNGLGAGIDVTGYLDQPTARALSKVAGSRWMTMPWSTSISAVLSAKDAGLDISDPPPEIFVPNAVGGIPGIPGLPDVPGGVLTYGLAAYLLYRHFKKRSR